MSIKVLTLFGEEIVPEQLNAVGRGRSVVGEPEEKPKRKRRKKPEDTEEEADATEATATDNGQPEENEPIAENAMPVANDATEAAAGLVAESIPEPATETPQPEITTHEPAATKPFDRRHFLQMARAQVTQQPPAELTIPEPQPEVTLPQPEIPAPTQPVEEPVINLHPTEEDIPQPVTEPPIPEMPVAEPAPTENIPPQPENDTQATIPVKKKPGRKKKTEQPAAVAMDVITPKTDILDGWAADKQYYTIGEVATLFEVKTSNIRFWTNEFALKVRTTRKGDRLYTPDQVREIRTIYYLVKEKKYTIKGAKAKLKETKKVPVQSFDLKQSLLQLRNKLVTLRNQLV